jgi:hypothetical protein
MFKDNYFDGFINKLPLLASPVSAQLIGWAFKLVIHN